jgi:class 3 adenylate cyclase
MVAFGSASDALRCAIAMQQASRRPVAGERLAIRVGLNAGEAFWDEADYFGPRRWWPAGSSMERS